MPEIRDGAAPPRALFWEHGGAAAFREGEWKAVRLGAADTWKLFNLSRDATEMNDLSQSEAARLRELVGKSRAKAEELGVRENLPGR